MDIHTAENTSTSIRNTSVKKLTIASNLSPKHSTLIGEYGNFLPAPHRLLMVVMVMVQHMCRTIIAIITISSY